ncbi:FAD-dependent oxidoreductase [Candidatus Woesearchaeota archaeon]|nr:FAD-dependent oxidoreductase [Candidatus Woesearchaeota archaeon]
MKARVIDNHQETYNVKVLKIKPETSLSFKPGQFIMVNHNAIKDGNKIDVKRPYSICSSPLNKDYIELAFDIKPNGLVSRYLYNLKANDYIEISPPNGFFTFEDSIKENLVLIGAGTGIASLIGIIRHVKERNLKNKITLIYSCKTKNDIIYHNEIKNIKNHLKNFDFYITLTQDNEWNGLKGRVDFDMLKSIIDDFDNKLFYICGPPLMVLDISKMIQSLGVEKEKIKIEGYE